MRVRWPRTSNSSANKIISYFPSFWYDLLTGNPANKQNPASLDFNDDRYNRPTCKARRRPAHQGHGKAAARLSLPAISASARLVGLDQMAPLSEAEDYRQPMAGHVIINLRAVRRAHCGSVQRATAVMGGPQDVVSLPGFTPPSTRYKQNTAHARPLG